MVEISSVIGVFKVEKSSVGITNVNISRVDILIVEISIGNIYIQYTLCVKK